MKNIFNIRLIINFIGFFFLSCFFILGSTTMAQASSFSIELLAQPGMSSVLQIILKYVNFLIEQEEDNLKKYDITGWCTIRPQSNYDVSFDYGDDLIGSYVTFEQYDNKNQAGVMNIYDIGMKEDDSQSIFIKTVSDSLPDVYRLITPNGWKISEDVRTGKIILEEDTGAFNQMWEIYPDDNGLFYFYNKAVILQIKRSCFRQIIFCRFFYLAICPSDCFVRFLHVILRTPISTTLYFVGRWASFILFFISDS